MSKGSNTLAIVGEASRQMARLIDDLLHLSRVTRSELRRRPVLLSDLAGQIIAGCGNSNRNARWR